MLRFQQEKLEAPPGIEPGMEVLQTSALPLGDGAVLESSDSRAEARADVPAQAKAWANVPRTLAAYASRTNNRPGKPPGRGRNRNQTCVPSKHAPSAFARCASARYPSLGLPNRKLTLRRERRLERETGFEPATSTLARSHSTTELFPPVGRSRYGTTGSGG